MHMGRIKKVRGIKAASRIGKEKLIENAEILAAHPEKILPVCNNNCTICVFAPLKEKLKKVSANRDNKARLKWAVLFGNKIIKAYAGFISIRHGDSLAVLATVKLPSGTYSFAMRSNAPREIQLAIQHFDEPLCKALAYLTYAKKGYFFVVADDLYCSGRELKLPEQFKREVVRGLPYKLNERDGILTCPHVHERHALTIKIKNTDFEIEICDKCATSDVNLLSHVASKILGRHIEKFFEVSFKARYACAGKCKTCRFSEIRDTDIENNYKKGLLSDSATVRKFIEKQTQQLRASHTPVYILENTCFGTDMHNFVRAFCESEEERSVALQALEHINDAVILRDRSFAKFLEEIWPRAGREALCAVSSEEIADKYYTTEGNPIDTLKKAKKEFATEKVLSQLPELKNLPPVADFVHHTVIEYKTYGKNAAISYISGRKLENTNMKSIAYAFLNYFGVSDTHAWQFTKEEKELGVSLYTQIDALLKATGKEYKKILTTIIKHSGSSEDIA